MEPPEIQTPQAFCVYVLEIQRRYITTLYNTIKEQTTKQFNGTQCNRIQNTLQ